MRSPTLLLLLLLALAPVLATAGGDAAPDLVLHHGKIVTVDDRFSVGQAMAVKAGRIVRVGSDREVLALAGPRTERVDLRGKMVLPGLIDSHTHPAGASMTEFDHPIPDMESIADVLAYIRERAKVVPEGEWIQVRQVFITRLREQRYPTRAELDAAAPRHPVLFSTGPDAALNTLALRESGMERGFTPPDGGPGYLEVDPTTGEPTGILRNLGRFLRPRTTTRRATAADEQARLCELFADYNANGITAIADRNASAEAVSHYRQLRDAGRLTVRISVSRGVGTQGELAAVQAAIRAVARDPLRRPDPWLQIVGIKTFLDGGMLTGSALMREPWGVSRIYGITDPSYRGLQLIPADRLLAIVRTAIEEGLQFTAHAVGDGAVHALLDAYDEVARTRPIAATRPCITHANFMSAEAVRRMAELRVVADIQPIWLYLDTRTLVAQFGYARMRYFQPLRSLFAAGAVVGGGSDHMQKIGALRAINPYHPFLGMWITLTRRANGYRGRLHPEEALTRRQAIEFYTRNNAYLLFRDHEIGSLEPGKRADFIVVDRDLLTCPVDDIRTTRVLATYVDGRRVFAREGMESSYSAATRTAESGTCTSSAGS